MTTVPKRFPLLADPWFGAMVSVGLFLGLLHLVLIPVWGAGPVLAVLPWFTPILCQKHASNQLENLLGT